MRERERERERSGKESTAPTSVAGMEMSPRLRVTPPSTGGGAARSPSAAGALADEAIWKKLRDAGFDEETVRRRDKAALISYVTKLESEIYDYQNHMGLLILEKKEWASKYEQIRASAESAENAYKHDQAAYLSTLAEAKKREENLKKALGIEKECLANIEQALHDIRAESAERKLEYEGKLAEAHLMMETAQKKFEEAEGKLRAVELLHAEANRCRDTALRNLQDVEAREDELRRRLDSFKSECAAKEKEINLQRQSLYESQNVFHVEEERIQEKQKILNQREEYIIERLKELSLFEKKLDEAKAKFEEECRAQKDEKSKLDLEMSALETREEALIQRESLLDKRERESLILQEKIANKEYDEIQKRTEEHQLALEKRNEEFETELQQRRMLFEDEMNIKLSVLVDREAEINQREKMLMERENALELQLSALTEKQDDLTKKLKLFEGNEQDLQATQSTVESKMLDLHRETENVTKTKADLERVRSSLEDEKKEILHVQNKLELTISERNELLVLEMKLKEEIDNFRTQKMELESEADKLKAAKEKFEAEWELIDEKREELRKEAESIAEEREAVSKYLKNEHDSIKQEKEMLRSQLKNEAQSLSHEREEFMIKMEHEHSDWLNRIQREREDFVEDIKIQRRELENCFEKRQEEIENYLRQKEEAFELEKAKELHYINSQKEMIAKDLEHVASELKRLNNERMEIALDREQREKEWSEIKNSVEMLNSQREKLQKQRELLHADREEIIKQIQYLKRLEDLNLDSENRALSKLQSYQENCTKWNVPIKKCSNSLNVAKRIKYSDEKEVHPNLNSTLRLFPEKASGSVSSPTSATFSWVRKFAGIIFNHSPEKNVNANDERSAECKVSSKPVEVSVGNENTPRSNLQENKNFGDDQRATMLKMGRLQDPSAVVDGMNSNKQKSTGRKRGTESKRPDLVDSTAICTMPAVDKNAEDVLNMEPINITEKNSNQLKEDVAQDMSGQRSRLIGSGVKSSLSGRKRLNSSLSSDHNDVCLEPSQKNQKKMNKKESDHEQEAISNCVPLTQAPYSDDNCGLGSFNQTLVCREISQGCTDKEQEIPELCNFKPLEASQSKVLHTDIVDNGISRGSGNPAHVGNGILSSSSCQRGILKSQEKSAAELAVDNCNKSIEQDEYSQDSDDEDNEEDEERMSIKEKLWVFLTT